MIDWTPIMIALVGGIFSTIGIIATDLINRNVKDAAAAATLNNAVKNSLGAIEQATDEAVRKAAPHTVIPGVTPQMAVGIQYTLDHAGAEAARFGITPAAIAEKINAQIGLAKIAVAEGQQPAPPVAS